MSMSLDGYVADLNDGVAEVFDWYVNSGAQRDGIAPSSVLGARMVVAASETSLAPG
jgi:hypothetical protein